MGINSIKTNKNVKYSIFYAQSIYCLAPYIRKIVKRLDPNNNTVQVLLQPFSPTKSVFRTADVSYIVEQRIVLEARSESLLTPHSYPYPTSPISQHPPPSHPSQLPPAPPISHHPPPSHPSQLPPIPLISHPPLFLTPHSYPSPSLSGSSALESSANTIMEMLPEYADRIKSCDKSLHGWTECQKAAC